MRERQSPTAGQPLADPTFPTNFSPQNNVTHPFCARAVYDRVGIFILQLELFGG